MTHFSLDLPVQAHYDFQKDRNLRSQMLLGPLRNGAVGAGLFRRAICRYEVEEANTGMLGCQRQVGSEAAWDGPSEGKHAVGLGYPVQVETMLAGKRVSYSKGRTLKTLGNGKRTW